MDKFENNQEKISTPLKVEKANELSWKTFSYLKVNHTEVEIPSLEEIDGRPVTFPDCLKDKEFGASPEIVKIHQNYSTIVEEYKVNEGEGMDFGKITRTDKNTIDTVHVHAEKDGILNLILEYNIDEPEAFRSSLISVHAEEGAHINLYLVNLNHRDTTDILSLVTVVDERANINVFQYEVSESDGLIKSNEYLVGEKSHGNIYGIYLGQNHQKLDFLYDILHIGAKSTSNLIMDGALLSGARKVFKSQLNFDPGASESYGNEEEFALLLDDTARSFSVPGLLTGEHDVEGNHAASAGHIDQKELFYIMSRGFEQKEAERLIIEARFSPVIDKLNDEDLRNQLKSKLHEALERRS